MVLTETLWPLVVIKNMKIVTKILEIFGPFLIERFSLLAAEKPAGRHATTEGQLVHVMPNFIQSIRCPIVAEECDATDQHPSEGGTNADQLRGNQNRNWKEEHRFAQSGINQRHEKYAYT